MSTEPTRAAVLRAAEAVKEAHALALGACDTERGRLAAAHHDEETTTQAETRRALAIVQNRAANAVMTAHAHARDVALGLAAGEERELLRVATGVDVGELVVNARPAGLHSPLNVPLVVPLLGSGNVVVFGDGGAADSLIRSIQLEALRHTTPGQLELVSYDPRLRNPLAPFTQLNGSSGALVRTLQDARDLEVLIAELSAKIARVGSLLQGDPEGLVGYRSRVGLPVEQYTLVTLHDYPLGATEQHHARLVTLAEAAAIHGISFLFHVPDVRSSPPWLATAGLRALGEIFEVAPTRTVWARHPDLLAAIPEVRPSQAAAVATAMATTLKSLAAPVVPFTEIEPARSWGESSADGITFVLGRAGHQVAEVRLGDEATQKHHVLITGATGQGKSNLLKVVIHSLASRYSPDELQFLLLDFKEGVTLYPMAPTPGSPEYLPHARVLGLEADQDFGLAVLRHLKREYERRMKLIKPFGDDIAKYRRAQPDAILPRLVLIADEFQLLLENRDKGVRTGSRAAELLEELVRLGRAAGIHVILASQSISGISTLMTSGQGVFSQVPVRIGLKNSAKDAITTFEQGNEAAARLRFRGEAILNLDHGAIASNQLVVVARADEAELERRRGVWCRKIAGRLAPPTVFDGSQPSRFLVDLGAVAAAGASRRGGQVRAFLGRPVTVDQSPTTFALDRTPACNVAIVGTSMQSNDDPDGEVSADNTAIGLVQAMSLSLAAQHDPATAEFVVLDLLTERDRAANNIDRWLTAMEAVGHRPRVVPEAEAKAWVVNAAAGLADRAPGAPPTYVFGLGLERVGQIDVREGGMNSVPAQEAFHTLWKIGPTRDVHSFFWWSHAPTFLTHVNGRPVALFSGTVLLHGAADAARQIHGVLAVWEGERNRALFGDASGGLGERKILPYSPVELDDFEVIERELTRVRA